METNKSLYQYQKQTIFGRNNLNKTDYKSIKMSEKIVLLLAQKFLSESNPDLVAEFSTLTAKRQEWRDEINQLEEQIKTLRGKEQ